MEVDTTLFARVEGLESFSVAVATAGQTDRHEVVFGDTGQMTD